MRVIVVAAALLAAGCVGELSFATDPSELGPGDPGATGWREPLGSPSHRIGFNLVNPAVGGYAACFGVPMSQAVHAGEDLFGAAGAPVAAVGAGTVVYAANPYYPGLVVVIRHPLSEAERDAVGADAVYSQYGHLGTVAVASGDQVEAGQPIATVLAQGANSHVHWEMRTVDTVPLCGNTQPGPGYTGPGTDATDFGYLDPSGTLAELERVR